MLMTTFVNTAWPTTQIHRTLRLSMYPYCSTWTRPIWPTLGMHHPGQSICSLKVNPNTSGLCPHLLHVTTLHIQYAVGVLHSNLFVYLLSNHNIITSYQIEFKITTRNTMAQAQQPQLLHTAKGN